MGDKLQGLGEYTRQMGRLSTNTP